MDEGGRAGGLSKNTRKKRDLCSVFVATKRVLISGEKDSREPPAWLRARERRPASNKILLQLDALHGAQAATLSSFQSYFDLAKGSHIPSTVILFFMGLFFIFRNYHAT